MYFEQIDRPQRKREAAELLRTAQVSPKLMTVFYLLIVLLLDLINNFTGGILGMFSSVLILLISVVLGAGYTLYCMALRRGERAEYVTLFAGFSFAGKIILLDIVSSLFVFLWSMLFFIPGIIAAYRYRFAKLNLYENPDMGVFEALNLSKRQTMGYKSQLFLLDLSYLGWNLAASVPSMVLNILMNQELTQAVLYGIPATNVFWGLPMLAWTLVIGVWQIAVSPFYLPNYTCVSLSYFETAKSTSGLGKDAPPQSGNPPFDSGSWTPPDGL